MKRRFFTLCISMFVLMLPIIATAQEADTLSQKFSKLENILSKLPKVSGVINFRYRYDEDKSTFDIRRARLDVKGDINKMFDYRVQVEFASSPKLLDAQIRAKIKPYFNIQIGQFKVPFSLENPYSPITLECIDNAMAITKLVGYEDISGINANGRDIGVMVYGGVFKREGYHIFNYSIGVFNGAGINVRDNNKSKDIIARIDVNPIKPITLSVSGYLGEVYLNDSTRHATRDRLGFGLRYDDKKWLFRSEYIYGITHKTESMGAYAVLAYTFFGKLQPLIRLDYFQQDLKTLPTRELDYMAGVNYWFIPQKAGLQLNFTYKTFEDSKRNAGYLCLMGTVAF